MNLLLTYLIDALAIFILASGLTNNLQLFGMEIKERLSLQSRLILALLSPVLSIGLAASIGILVSFIQTIVR
jgi:accessory gene regulator protein AgrB